MTTRVTIFNSGPLAVFVNTLDMSGNLTGCLILQPGEFVDHLYAHAHQTVEVMEAPPDTVKAQPHTPTTVVLRKDSAQLELPLNGVN